MPWRWSNDANIIMSARSLKLLRLQFIEIVKVTVFKNPAGTLSLKFTDISKARFYVHY